jgi:hypothetical protein
MTELIIDVGEVAGYCDAATGECTPVADPTVPAADAEPAERGADDPR